MVKIRLILAYVILIMLFVAVSCQKPNSSEYPDSTTCFPLESTDAQKDLSPYIDSIQVIPLINENGQSLLDIDKMILNQGTFLILSRGVLYSFDPESKEIKAFGTFGRGPGEYTSIVDFCVNRQSNCVDCLVFPHAVLQYDINTHRFIKQIDLSGDYINPAAIIPSDEDGYYVYYANPAKYDKASLEEPFYCVKRYDKQGGIVDETMLRTDFHIAGLIKPSFCFDSNYSLSPGSVHSPSLIIRNGKIEEAYLFDFGSKTLPYRYAYKADDDPWNSIADIFIQDYYKLLSSFVKTEHFLFFSAFGANSQFWNFYIGEKAGIRWQSVPITSSPMKAVGAADGFIYFCYDDCGLRPLEEEKDPLKLAALMRSRVSEYPEAAHLLKVKFKVL